MQVPVHLRGGAGAEVSPAVVLFLPRGQLSTRALSSVPVSVMGRRRED